jgi:hypothetical protein
MGVALIVLMALSAALGLAVARLWVVGVAAAAIVAFYIGLDSGVWGNGTGDGWEFVMAFMVLVASAITFACVTLRRVRKG